MLQTATWGLGRRQRRLLPLVTPILASHRSISHTRSRYAAGAAEAIAARDDSAEPSTNSTPSREPNAFLANSLWFEDGVKIPSNQMDDVFAVAPILNDSALSRRQRKKLKQRFDFMSKQRRSDRVSDNIDPSFFEKYGSRKSADVSRKDIVDDPLPVDDGPADGPIERSAAGFLPSRLPTPSRYFSVNDEVDMILDSFQDLDSNSWESKTILTKSYGDTGPGFIFQRIMAEGALGDAWRRKVAIMRSMRFPVIVMQMMVRRDALRPGGDRTLLSRLPKGEHLRAILQIIIDNGYTRQDFRNMMHVIKGGNDVERCQRFLKLEGRKPIWLYHFVIRRQANIGNIATLKELITYCATKYDGIREPKHLEPSIDENDPQAKRPELEMKPYIFCHTIRYLAAHCMEWEDRLLLEVADLAMAFIKNIETWDFPKDRIFFHQSELFNEVLGAFSPNNRRMAPLFARDAENYWEAQKRLLSMSASFDHQLLVSKRGFEAVRAVLSGLKKNTAEVHNSKRHAATWPPYLQPGDGIDEATDPEENWSRVVSAGTLQQEAGFPLDEEDQALDVLQGRAPDGTPTIQQRLTRQPTKLDTWSASIKATRNAVEAWDKFRNPPERGLTPTVHQYGAMFAKLHLRDADPVLDLRPGDRALNFPVKEDPNLSEFALARMAPPSVDALYREMRAADISPSGNCLDVLVANAESLAIAHKYLRDSKEKTWPLVTTSRKVPVAAASLREVRTPLVAAYVKAACKRPSLNPHNVLRAIQICEARFQDEDTSRVWAPFAWSIVLRACSDMRSGTTGIGKSLTEQIGAYNLVVDNIEKTSRPTLATLVQFSRCLRSATARALGTHIQDPQYAVWMHNSPLRFMYDTEFREEVAQQTPPTKAGLSKYGIRGASWVSLFAAAAQRMKEMIKTLEQGESETSDMLRTLHMPLESMQARRDLVRATDASAVMVCWAFLGEYEMMASLLEVLVERWSSSEIVQQLEGYEVLPSFADFNELLCIFRRFGEPMLSEERVKGLREKVESAEVAWTWPNEELLVAFDETRDAISYRRLRHVLEWTRYRQARGRGEDPETLVRPQKWVEDESSRFAYQNDRLGIEDDPKESWTPTA